jgi:hypothetical protein
MRAWPDVVYRQGKKLKAHWDLKGLNQFARTVGCLDYRAFLAAERIRKRRNLVHPNWFASRTKPQIKKSVFVACETDLDEVWRSINFWLFGDAG